MPEFSYIARDKNGKKVFGHRKAGTAEELADQLQSERLIPLEITPIKSTEKSKSKSINITIFEAPPSQKEIQMFCRQMYTLLKVGIPIVSAVTKLVETTKDPQLVKALNVVLSSLNQGNTLSEGLAKSPKVFSSFFVNLIKVGETSGQLDKMFLYLNEYVQFDVELDKKMKAAFRYPKMVGIGLILAMFVINTFVIPAFVDLFASIKGTLPLPTRILIASSNFFLDYWYYMLGFMVLGFFAFRYAVKTPVGKIKWAQMKLKMPIVGWISQRITLTRFAKLYAMVLRAGLTASQGITLVGESSHDAYFAEKVKAIAGLVARGNTIASALAQTQYFPPLMLQMVALGEESGNIDGLLDEVGDFYQRELVYDLARMSELIEPILLVVAGGFVLLLALGVFLPMWDMASQMKKG